MNSESQQYCLRHHHHQYQCNLNAQPAFCRTAITDTNDDDKRYRQHLMTMTAAAALVISHRTNALTPSCRIANLIEFKLEKIVVWREYVLLCTRLKQPTTTMRTTQTETEAPNKNELSRSYYRRSCTYLRYNKLSRVHILRLIG